MLQAIFEELVNQKNPGEARTSKILDLLFWSLCVEKINDYTQEKAVNKESLNDISSEHSQGLFDKSYAIFVEELGERYILFELKAMVIFNEIKSVNNIYPFLL